MDKQKLVRKGTPDLNEVKTMRNKTISTPQDLVNYISLFLDMKYEVVNNLMGYEFLAKISFKNTGGQTIPSGRKWTIYFYSFRMIHGGGPNGLLVADGQLNIKHHNGDFFSMSVTDEFRGIAPDKTLSFTFKAAGWCAARSDLSPNWYVTAPKAKSPKILAATADKVDYVQPFNTAAKWKRDNPDTYNPLIPEKRYKQNEISSSKGKVPENIMPTPLQMKISKETSTIEITKDWVVVAAEILKSEADHVTGITVTRFFTM